MLRQEYAHAVRVSKDRGAVPVLVARSNDSRITDGLFKRAALAAAIVRGRRDPVSDTCGDAQFRRRPRSASCSPGRSRAAGARSSERSTEFPNQGMGPAFGTRLSRPPPECRLSARQLLRQHGESGSHQFPTPPDRLGENASNFALHVTFEVRALAASWRSCSASVLHSRRLPPNPGARAPSALREIAAHLAAHNTAPVRDIAFFSRTFAARSKVDGVDNLLGRAVASRDPKRDGYVILRSDSNAAFTVSFRADDFPGIRYVSINGQL